MLFLIFNLLRRLEVIVRRLVDCVRARDYDVGFVREFLPSPVLAHPSC